MKILKTVEECLNLFDKPLSNIKKGRRDEIIFKKGVELQLELKSKNNSTNPTLQLVILSPRIKGDMTLEFDLCPALSLFPKGMVAIDFHCLAESEEEMGINGLFAAALSHLIRRGNAEMEISIEGEYPLTEEDEVIFTLRSPVFEGKETVATCTVEELRRFATVKVARPRGYDDDGYPILLKKRGG